MFKLNTTSGRYILIEPLDFGILNEHEMKDRLFLVHYVPEAERISIKIILKKEYLVFVKIRTKKFTSQIGKDLENLLSKMNVLTTSGIFIVDTEYICELIMSAKNRNILTSIKNDFNSIKGINFEITELNVSNLNEG